MKILQISITDMMDFSIVAHVSVIFVFLQLLLNVEMLCLYKYLNKMLNYIESSDVQKTPELILGTILATGQIMEISWSNNSHAAKMKGIIERCATLRAKMEKNGNNYYNYNALVGLNINNLALWIQPKFHIKFSMLFHWTIHFPSHGINYMDIVDSGHPSELESDQCLAEILNSHVDRISTKCLIIMDIVKDSYGYHLTHKLLFYTMLIRTKMYNSLPIAANIKFKIAFICSRILLETEYIASIEYPEILQDLFIEQILLCGIMGYSEFFKKIWFLKIISWQKKNGCFGQNVTENHLTENLYCTNHMTGLGIGVLAMYCKLFFIVP